MLSAAIQIELVRTLRDLLLADGAIDWGVLWIRSLRPLAIMPFDCGWTVFSDDFRLAVSLDHRHWNICLAHVCHNTPPRAGVSHPTDSAYLVLAPTLALPECCHQIGHRRVFRVVHNGRRLFCNADHGRPHSAGCLQSALHAIDTRRMLWAMYNELRENGERCQSFSPVEPCGLKSRIAHGRSDVARRDRCARVEWHGGC